MIKFNKAGMMIIIILSMLPACTLKKYFPNKEQDYQFRTEIAPLIVPQDLNHNLLKRAEIIPEQTLSEEVIETTVVSQTIPSIAKNESPNRSPASVDFVVFEGGVTRLRINEDLAPAWRLVAKALSRNRIEITRRNKKAGLLAVQYDPNKTDFTDDSVKDEFLFIFAEDRSQEQEFHIKVIEYNNMIEVIVLDNQNKPLSEGPGLQLLKLLFSSIHTELSTHQ
jgi:outer membrane protein assembly factor BamC